MKICASCGAEVADHSLICVACGSQDFTMPDGSPYVPQQQFGYQEQQYAQDDQYGYQDQYAQDDQYGYQDQYAQDDQYGYQDQYAQNDQYGYQDQYAQNDQYGYQDQYAQDDQYGYQDQYAQDDQYGYQDQYAQDDQYGYQQPQQYAQQEQYGYQQQPQQYVQQEQYGYQQQPQQYAQQEQYDYQQQPQQYAQQEQYDYQQQPQQYAQQEQYTQQPAPAEQEHEPMASAAAQAAAAAAAAAAEAAEPEAAPAAKPASRVRSKAKKEPEPEEKKEEVNPYEVSKNFVFEKKKPEDKQEEPEEEKPPLKGWAKILDMFTNTPDHTEDFDPADIARSKTTSIVAMFGITFWVPYAFNSRSVFSRYYANQGLLMLIFMLPFTLIYSMFAGIVGVACTVPPTLANPHATLGFMGVIMDIFFFLVCYAIPIFMIYNAIRNINAGKAKDLPFIGFLRLIR